MDAYLLHERVIDSYRKYLTSFINISDERISKTVLSSFEKLCNVFFVFAVSVLKHVLYNCVAVKPTLRAGALQVGALRAGALQDWCRGFDLFPGIFSGNSRQCPGIPVISRDFLCSRAGW